MTASSTPRLAARDVSFSYGDTLVLDRVGLDVGRGEIFGLLGPNGSGKSTLLAILTGSAPMQGGEILLDGVRVDPMGRAYRREIGVVFQSPALDQKLTVRENLELVATLHGIRGQAAVAAISDGLELARLADRAGDRVAQLSGGMRRRLDIARALLPRPGILFMDEPTTGLDEASYRALWSHLRAVNERQKVTIIVSTHRSEEAEQCDRLCVLAGGAVVDIATPRELCARLSEDLVVLSTRDPDAAAAALGERFDGAVEVVGSELRIGATDGHAMVPAIFEALPRGLVTSVAVRRPGLSDAYLSLTGTSLEEEDAT